MKVILEENMQDAVGTSEVGSFADETRYDRGTAV